MMLDHAVFNGGFEKWTLGTLQTQSGYGAADGWLCEHNGSSKQFSKFPGAGLQIPGGPSAISKTIVSSVIGSGNYVRQTWRIRDVARYAGQRKCVNFYAASDVPRNIAVEIVQRFGTGGNPSLSATGLDHGQRTLVPLKVGASLCSAVFDFPSIDSKIIGSNGDSCLEINFWFDAGTNFSMRTAGLGQQSGEFYLGEVWLGDPGELVRPKIPIELVEELCCTRVLRLQKLMFSGNRASATSVVAVYGSWALPKVMAVPPNPVITKAEYSAGASGLSALDVTRQTLSMKLDIAPGGGGYGHCQFDLDLKADL
jgi:hypothetical protein